MRSTLSMYSRVVAEVNVSPLSADERRQRARQAILEAFAERPMKLIQGEVVESKVIAGRDIAADAACNDIKHLAAGAELVLPPKQDKTR